MIEITGNLSLCGAVLAAAGAMLASIAAARLDSNAALRGARWLIGLVFVLFTLASGAHLTALLTDDFRFIYVAGYIERALPWGYKAAAFWAGQEGSLLLWAWLLAGLCVIAVIGWRKQSGQHFAIAHTTLAAVVGFFAVLLLFAANPFQMFEAAPPTEGRGLNPQLQDIGMIIHPPLLFIGYAGYTIPFALLIGVLAAGQAASNRWLAAIRRWLLFSWLFLGAGIVVGAWWAYVELGWGGYWAWDPVENASLLPWLTGTAVLHSLIVQQHRGMFKRWNASLIAVTFVLCIFGTYLTRSGVIDSVHAFAPSMIGTFFLCFLGLTVLASVGLLAWRFRMLAPERLLDGIVSREGMFLISNVLLVLMTLVTLVGTVFPLISGVFVEEPVTVKPAFYDRVVAPMALLLVAMMAIAPVLTFGAQAAQKIARRLTVPSIAALIVTLMAVAWTRNIWALICVAIVALGTGTVIVDFIRMFSARRRSTGEGPLTCGARLIDRDHRRYGGQLAHLGVMLIVIGVAGSSLFSTENVYRLVPGSDEVVGLDRYTLKLTALDEVRRENYGAVQATVELTDAGGTVRTLTPQRRFYDRWADQPNSEVAVHSTWREDVYLSLAGWEDGGRMVALQVKVNPLVLWIWIGGIVMSAGCVFCMLPRLLPQRVVAEQWTSAPEEAREVHGELAISSAAAFQSTNGARTTSIRAEVGT